MSWLGKGVLLGVNECAKICKVSKQAIRKSIKEKRLSAVKIGNSWVVHPLDLNYFNMTRTRGNPNAK